MPFYWEDKLAEKAVRDTKRRFATDLDKRLKLTEARLGWFNDTMNQRKVSFERKPASKRKLNSPDYEWVAWNDGVVVATGRTMEEAIDNALVREY